MKLRFNQEKATQIACLLLKKNGGRMAHLKLMKLMYLIDRKSLLRWGWSMTGDKYVSMKNGMVLSNTLDLINEESIPQSYWKEHITPPDNYIVDLIDTPEIDELSISEISLIDEVYAEFGDKNRWYLVDEVHHRLPEWIKTDSSIPVEYAEVLSFEHKSKEEIDEILSEMEAVSQLEHITIKC